MLLKPDACLVGEYKDARVTNFLHAKNLVMGPHAKGTTELLALFQDEYEVPGCKMIHLGHV